MKIMLLALAVVALACAGDKSSSSDTTAVVPVSPSDYAVVERKTPPDSLFDSQGNFCIVEGSIKDYEAVQLGGPYECKWRPLRGKKPN